MTNPHSPRQPLAAIPADLVSIADYERLAPEFMAKQTFAYISGGAGNEITLQRNRDFLNGLEIHQRVLMDFHGASTAIPLLGHLLKHPILLAPVAHQKLVHPQGELATASAADATDTLLVTSTLSHTPLESIAQQTAGPKWFQLYFQPTRDITLSLVKRAEAAGYSALVVTVDVPVNGLRYRAQRAGFTLPAGLTEANLESYHFPPPRTLEAHQSVVFEGIMADAPTWQDIEWLLDNTSLPVLIKGITHPDDAIKARAMGVAGIIVSNHGGRSLDGLPAAAKTLPAIRQETGRDYPLLLDSGIRSGMDAFKALALGANAVLVGRPQIYALAVAGPLGVAHMLHTLKTELEVAMALSGCPTLNDITPDSLHPWN